jgi:hypothetical protein
MAEELENKLRRLASDWPTKKIELLPIDIVALLNEKDEKIRLLEERLRLAKTSTDTLDRKRV